MDAGRTPSTAVVRVSSTDAGSAAIVVTVSLRMDANSTVRTWVEDDPAEVLPANVEAASFAAVADKASQRGATQVVIDVDERTTYGYVVGLIDALHKVGITHVAIQLVPSTAQRNAVKP